MSIGGFGLAAESCIAGSEDGSKAGGASGFGVEGSTTGSETDFVRDNSGLSADSCTANLRSDPS